MWLIILFWVFTFTSAVSIGRAMDDGKWEHHSTKIIPATVLAVYTYVAVLTWS